MSAALGDTITGEVYLDGLTPFEARELTDEIRQTLTLGHDLLIRAFTGRAWVALGYPTWDGYCSGEFSEARMVRLDREQRREIVAEMRDAGMSTRAIASGLGVDQSTVADDIRREGNPSPAPIVGTDGKTYQPPVPSAADAPAGPAGPPFTDRYDRAVADARRVVARIQGLHCDDQFTTHRSSLDRRHSREVTALLEKLGKLAEDLQAGRVLS